MFCKKKRMFKNISQGDVFYFRNDFFLKSRSAGIRLIDGNVFAFEGAKYVSKLEGFRLTNETILSLSMNGVSR